MKILGIESSCDETAIGIVDENKNILSAPHHELHLAKCILVLQFHQNNP